MKSLPEIDLSSIYAMGDGDNIRQRIEREVLHGNVDACRRVSGEISVAMDRVRCLALATTGCEVVFCGGDDILLRIDRKAYSPTLVRRMMSEFEHASGLTMCFGVADTLVEAYLNLRKAKASGYGVLVTCDVDDLDTARCSSPRADLRLARDMTNDS